MTIEAQPAAVKRIAVSGIAVEVVRKDIKNLHLGVYPPLGRVRVAAPLVKSDEAVRLPDLASPLKPLGTCNAWSPGWPLRSSVARRGGDCAAVCRRLAQATQRSWLR